MDGSVYLVAGFIGFIIGAWIAAAIFRSNFDVSDHHKQMLQQTRLLAMIAKQLGVPVDDVREVIGIKPLKKPKATTASVAETKSAPPPSDL